MPLKSIYRAPWFVKVIFTISFFLIFFVAGVTYKSMNDLSKSSDLVKQKYEISIELEQILSYLKDAETGQRGFLIIKDSMYLEPYLLGRENINNSFAELKALITKDEVEQQRNLIDLSFLIDNSLENFEQVQLFISRNQNSTSNSEFKALFIRGKLIMDQIRAKVKEMLEVQNKKLDEYQKE